MIRLLLNTNIVIDFINRREPHFQAARLLMLLGKMGEFELWVSSNQITDVIYIASDGGKKKLLPAVLRQLQDLRTFVKVFPVSAEQIDRMLAGIWKDPEDGLLIDVAVACNANAIVTRNQADFKTDLLKVCNCEELFDWLHTDFNLDYSEIDF